MNSTPSTLEFALAGLLRFQPQSGYDLRKSFATTALRHFSDSPGSIYPALKRLQVRSWIEVDTAAAPNPPSARGRTVYRITGQGTDALLAWLTLPVTRDDIIWRSQELMLRFAFFDGNIPRAATLRFLDQFIQALAAYLAELGPGFERMAAAGPVHTGLLAFQSGIEGMEAQLTWARRARALLAENSQ